MTDDDFDRVLRFTAAASRDHAYRPYSDLAVGAALEVELGDGTRAVFGGCNVENASFGLTMCAERVAVGNAVAAGARRVLRVVIATEGERPLTPCGACRQVLAEFAGPDVEVLCTTSGGAEVRYTIADLLPASMGQGDLPGRGAESTSTGRPGGSVDSDPDDGSDLARGAS